MEKENIDEKVEKFDKKLEKYEDYYILMGKVVRYLIDGIWSILLMIPVQEYDKTMGVIFLLGAFQSILTISLYLNIYMKVQESESCDSIYIKLRYIPVSAKSIFRVRLRYLCHYCKMKAIVYLLLQIIITLIALRTLSIWNVLYPLTWIMATSFLPGIVMIYPWKINGFFNLKQ